MFLSRLILNPRHRQVQREIADPYQRHRTIMTAFPEQLPPDERVLHRMEVDSRTGAVTLLVQSVHQPDWDPLAEKTGYLLTAPEIRSFQTKARSGQLLHFRLHANPTVKLKRDGHKNSNRVPLKREDEQLAWLQRKAKQHGFRLLVMEDDIPLVRVTRLGEQSGEIVRETTRHTVHIYIVQFDGLLQVMDPAAFRQALQEGIGPAKAFGCGLLSIAPVQ